MTSADYSRLLDLLWRMNRLTDRDIIAVGGERVSVVSPGEYDEASGVWYNAEIIVDGERRRGAVAVGEVAEVPESAILRVVSGEAQPVLGMGDALIPQIMYGIDEKTAECYEALAAGSADHDCAVRIAEMDSLHRVELFTKLLVDRLQRKTGDVRKIFTGSQKDWNQTFHVMLLRAMGGNRNREAFTELASRVTGAMISREKSSLEKVEALLLGGAGFLFADSGKDPYTLRLEDEFRHLANKYSIMPLKPAEWSLKKTYPGNHPAVRLAEIAALLSKKEFIFDNMLNCRTSADVEELFGAEASEYWNTHYKPGEASRPIPKRIGKGKARLIGINLVAPVMFAYGKETGSDGLCEKALDLLGDIPAEKNDKLAGWYRKGCVPGNSFESQALLQLNDEYCSSGGCALCHIGRSEIKKALDA